MMQIGIEFTPLFMGFGCGAALLLLQWLFPAAPRPGGAAGKREAKAEKLETEEPEHEEPDVEPLSEPGPEPALERPSRALAGLAAAALAAALLAAAAAAALGGGGLPPAARQFPAEPPQPEPAAPALLSQPEPTAPVLGLPQVADQELQGDEGSLAKAPEEADASDPVTLQLTRQTMAVENVGEIIHYKSAYWGSIAVGSPPVDYKVVFDTGSGYLILPSSFCHSETCRVHKRYRRPASRSAKDIDFDGTVVKPGEPRDEMTISFGTGEVTGVLVDDVTCLEGVSGTAPTACMPLSMIIATEMTEDPFRTFHFDGVLGLGLLGLSKASRFSLIHNVASTLAQSGRSSTPNLFSVFLGEHRLEHSDITFGGYVRDHLQDEISWNPVFHPELGHWMLEVKSLRIDDEVIEFCNEGCRAIVDTGTSLLAVPTPAFPEIHELLRHEAHDELDCKGPGPKLHIELEGLTLTLEPQDYAALESSLYGSPPKSRMGFPEPYAREGPIETEPEYCKPTLMSMQLPEPVGPKLFVLGEPVLRKYYTVFDFTESAPRIGFGMASHSSRGLFLEDDWDYEEGL